jgi:hypothetical protein
MRRCQATRYRFGWRCWLWDRHGYQDGVPSTDMRHRALVRFGWRVRWVMWDEWTTTRACEPMPQVYSEQLRAFTELFKPLDPRQR